jgi:hypothetical protein
VKGGGGAVPLSLSKFFDSDNIRLRQPLSMSKKFDSDNGCLNPTLEQFFQTYTDVELSCSTAGWK